MKIVVASTLLVVKAKSIYRKTIKVHISMEIEVSQQTVFRKSLPRHRDMHCLPHRRFVHFHCVSIYIFGFHNNQCASDYKDFTFVKFNCQLFSSADDSLKNEAPLPLL